MVPIVAAVEILGETLANNKICFWTDNISVVFAINNLTSSSLPVLALLRHLVFLCLMRTIWFRAKHVPGVYNEAADTLSLQWHKFRILVSVI